MSQATESFRPGQVLAGKYRLERLIGQGGMGSVWSAENVAIGRKVAIKTLHPQLAADPSVVARFRQEARAAAAIGHPGIVDVLDMGELPTGEAYLVMQHLQGETLGERILRAGPLEWPEAAHIAEQVLEAIAAAHDRGIVHRDLKPDNVFLAQGPPPCVKTLDFGISKLQGASSLELTRTGAVVGTPAYMAPEQARGAKEVGPAADLYAIGAILYEMLTARPPFRGDSYNEIIARILTEEKAPLAPLRPDVPEPVRHFVDVLMARAAEERPPSARHAALLLREALSASGLVEQGPAAPSPWPIPLVRVAASSPAPAPFSGGPAAEPDRTRISGGSARRARPSPRPQETAPAPVRARSRAVPQALSVAAAALVLGGGAALLRQEAQNLFAGVQGAAAGAVMGLVAFAAARKGRFALSWAAALSFLGAVCFSSAEILAGDLLRPFVVTGGYLASMLRGELEEWVFLVPAAGVWPGLAGGDALFLLTLLDAAAAAAVAPLTLWALTRRRPSSCPQRGATGAQQPCGCGHLGGTPGRRAAGAVALAALILVAGVAGLLAAVVPPLLR
jgi:serine/threonine protein kinase